MPYLTQQEAESLMARDDEYMKTGYITMINRDIEGSKAAGFANVNDATENGLKQLKIKYPNALEIMETRQSVRLMGGYITSKTKIEVVNGVTFTIKTKPGKSWKYTMGI